MTISISSSVHAWRSLPDALSPSLETLSHTLNQDPQWQAFINTEGIQHSVTIGVQSTSSDQVILVSVEPGPKTIVTTGPSSNADFVLVAQAEHWEKFFSAKPSAPFTSFVGIQVRRHLPLHSGSTSARYSKTVFRE